MAQDSLQCLPFCAIPGLLWTQTYECPSLFSLSVKRAALPSPVGSCTQPICCPTKVVTLPSLPRVKLRQTAMGKCPTTSRTTKTRVRARASVVTWAQQDNFTGHLVGPDIHSSSWDQAGAQVKRAQGGQAAARVWPGSALCHLHSLGSVLRAFRGSIEGSL